MKILLKAAPAAPEAIPPAIAAPTGTAISPNWRFTSAGMGTEASSLPLPPVEDPEPAQLTDPVLIAPC